MDFAKIISDQSSGSLDASRGAASLVRQIHDSTTDSPFGRNAIPMPRFPAVEVADHMLVAASKTVKVLERQIREVEAKLDEAHAIAFWIVGGPAGQAFMPQQISASNPDKIIFEGHDSEHQPFVLIQHVSQLNFVIRVTKLENGEKREPIGFHIPESK